MVIRARPTGRIHMAIDKQRRQRFNKKLGPKIQKLREKYNLTRGGLGDKLGLPRLTIWRWEAAQQTINFPDAEMVANFFGVKTDELLGEAWRPIDTAPKDGRTILSVAGEKPHREFKIIYWHKTTVPPNYGYWIDSESKCKPVYWQPLPLFPE